MKKGFTLIELLVVIAINGSFYNNNGGCDDGTRGYCIGVGTCGGW